MKAKELNHDLEPLPSEIKGQLISLCQNPEPQSFDSFINFLQSYSGNKWKATVKEEVESGARILFQQRKEPCHCSIDQLICGSESNVRGCICGGT
jgi:hypothetical protein